MLPAAKAQGGTWETAMQLNSGYTALGSLSDKHKADWYRIVVPEKQNGTVRLIVKSTDGLDLHHLTLHSLVDGKAVSRNSIYPSASSIKDGDTLIVDDVASGTYYVLVQHYSYAASYTLRYDFIPNPTPNDSEPNDTHLTGKALDSGKTATGHLGYRYHDEDTRDKADWYRIEVGQGGIVLLSVSPDTLSSLDIRRLSVYKKDGDKLREIKGVSVGEKAATLMANGVEPGTYYVSVEHWGGCGGYVLTYGNPVPAKGSEVKVDVTGRDKVRIGVPCRYGVTLKNTGAAHTGAFFFSVCGTDDIDMLGAELPSDNGVVKLSMADFGPEDSHTMCFIVPDLAPFEEYSFDVLVEGKEVDGTRSVVLGTALVTAAIGTILDEMADDLLSDFVTEKICDYVGSGIELDATERSQYVKALGKGVESAFEQKKDGVVVFTAKSVINNAAKKVIEMFPGGKIVTKVGDAFSLAGSVATAIRHRVFYWLYKEIGLIKDNSAVLDAKVAADGVVTSWDPNEKAGPKGYGPDNHIAKPQRMEYTIFFENKKEATAPAYRIRIEDKLAEVFDPATVRFGPTSHSGDGYHWQMSRDGNTLVWEIEGIELPPNVNAPEGEGYVSFSVDLKPGVENGTEIENKATVVFDKNVPIQTNTWRNVVDTEAPVTEMLPTGYDSGKGAVVVPCRSADDKGGSGVGRYIYYMSKNGGEYAYCAETNTPVLEYPLDRSSQDNYSFYAVAVDNVGNTEQEAPEPVTFSVTGIGEVEAGLLSVDSNPSDGLFRISVPEGVAGMDVYSAAGQAVWSADNLTGGRVVVDITGQPAGVYLLKAVINGKAATMKIVKK